MRTFLRWAWTLFFVSAAIYIWSHFASGRSDATHLALGLAFLTLGHANLAPLSPRGRPRAPRPCSHS